MTNKSSGRQQRYTSTQTQFFVWERCRSIHNRTQNGKINLKTSNSPTLTETYFESMGNQLSSSVLFSQDRQHCRFSKRFNTKWQLVKQVLKNLKTESSSCPCSTTAIEQRKEVLLNVFRILKRSIITQEGFSFDIGHSSVQEKKNDGMERTLTNSKESGILLLMSW